MPKLTQASLTRTSTSISSRERLVRHRKACKPFRHPFGRILSSSTSLLALLFITNQLQHPFLLTPRRQELCSYSYACVHLAFFAYILLVGVPPKGQEVRVPPVFTFPATCPSYPDVRLAGRAPRARHSPSPSLAFCSSCGAYRR
jgi:hypothetical protein